MYKGEGEGEVKGSWRGCFTGGEKGNDAAECTEEKSKQTEVCGHCGKDGHRQSQRWWRTTTEEAKGESCQEGKGNMTDKTRESKKSQEHAEKCRET